MYHQIRRYLEEKIVRGELKVGDRTPTEHELCELHDVSRITARKALALLQEEGIIRRRRGHGSFVIKPPEGNTTPQQASTSAKTPPTQATEIGILRTAHTNSPERDDWWHTIIRSFEDTLLAENYHPLSLPPLPEPGTSLTPLFARLDELGERLAGIVFRASSHASPTLINELKQRGIPWACINQIDRCQTANFVAVDNHGGGYELGLHFARLGYKPILVASTPLDAILSNADKFLGLARGYIAGGMDSADIRFLPLNELGDNEENRRLLLEQLQSAKRPRAIFCAGDILAATALRLCQAHGLTVPEDVAIVGGTNLILSQHTTPPLSVLAQPMAATGEALGRYLIEMIRTGRGELPGRFIPSPLIFRASCPAQGNASTGAFDEPA